MNLFWVDIVRDNNISYDDLYFDIVTEGERNIYINEEDPYLVFLNMLRNLLSEKKSIILDFDFSKDELIGLNVTQELIESAVYYQSNLSDKFNSLNEIISFFEFKKDSLEIEIFTSGTSGKPKKVTQTLANLIRGVKVNNNFSSSIWGFAYNPTHFAGLQVFFQAFFNKNPLIYVFKVNFENIFYLLDKYNVSHLSCTPTFMKLLLSNIEDPLYKIMSLTFGGERFDSKIEFKIKKIFPNASIKNIYASTEAGTILYSVGDYFIIPEKYEGLIRFEDNELLINIKLLGNSESFVLEGEWFRSGDLVEFHENERFKFIGRKSKMINVGGYKVNPSEVEEVIKNVIGVKDVHVFGRENSIMGNLVVAKVMVDDFIDEKELRQKIKEKCASNLQEFKIPRLINFVDSFELTRTGKIK
uniref:ANL family adenylate-forming protein n=1 Tax=Algoriphagus sp. TaxID=1872435 RepID=UPI0040478004